MSLFLTPDFASSHFSKSKKRRAKAEDLPQKHGVYIDYTQWRNVFHIKPKVQERNRDTEVTEYPRFFAADFDANIRLVLEIATKTLNRPQGFFARECSSIDYESPTTGKKVDWIRLFVRETLPAEIEAQGRFLEDVKSGYAHLLRLLEHIVPRSCSLKMIPPKTKEISVLA